MPDYVVMRGSCVKFLRCMTLLVFLCLPSCRHRSMERLVERLENAVIRLEKVSVKLQGQGMANGDIPNGINGGESAPTSTHQQGGTLSCLRSFWGKMTFKRL